MNRLVLIGNGFDLAHELDMKLMRDRVVNKMYCEALTE